MGPVGGRRRVAGACGVKGGNNPARMTRGERDGRREQRESDTQWCFSTPKGAQKSPDEKMQKQISQAGADRKPCATSRRSWVPGGGFIYEPETGETRSREMGEALPRRRSSAPPTPRLLCSFPHCPTFLLSRGGVPKKSKNLDMTISFL
jgi:hypothetical protein